MVLQTMDHPHKVEEKYALPEGDYVVVTWDMVTTGSNLYDDICQLVAFTPGVEGFSQHVMPYHNMSLGTRRRHSLNIIQTGRYRVLKDIRNNKTLVTKTAFMALNDFMDWLHQVKGSTDGIILVNHDSRQLITSILLEVITNYKMQDQFCSIVKGFANCCDIAESKCDKSVKPYSIRSLSTALLSHQENKGEYENRIQAIYYVVKHIFEGDQAEGVDKSNRQLAVDIREFCYTADGVYKKTMDLKAMQQREESLQPLFISMRNNRSDRQRSFNLQRLLARSNIDYDILSDINKKGGMDAIIEVLKCTMAQEHAREMEELKHIFAMHFNPDYKGEWKPAEKPMGDRPPRTFRRNSRSKRPNKKTPTTPEDESNKEPMNTASTSKGGAGDVPTVTITNEMNETTPVAAGV
ncbi:hypothetical protein B566_EDAN000864 [Ephemera danica]|nr:hypothetical protein B566_EDAN000864 [Ephemera danica]